MSLLAKLEGLTTVLIGCGVAYKECKAELETLVEEQRIRLIELMAAPCIEKVSRVH
jgi:hypothetical protein